MSELSEKLGSLYELQVIDNDLIKSLVELKHLENDEAPVQKKHRKLTERLEKLDGELDPIRQEIKEIQDKVVLMQAERKETDDKLMMSASGDHKMLQSYQQKRTQIMAQIKEYEDSILKKQTEMDTIGIKKHDVDVELKEIQSEFDSVSQQREERKSELQEKIDELKNERLSFKQFEDKSLLNRYQQLQKENNGVAIATVENDVCNSCFVEVSMATKKKLEYGEEIVCCTHCGCILILEGTGQKAAS